MLAVNYTELRGNMKECMDKVSDDYETIILHESFHISAFFHAQIRRRLSLNPV